MKKTIKRASIMSFVISVVLMSCSLFAAQDLVRNDTEMIQVEKSVSIDSKMAVEQNQNFERMPVYEMMTLDRSQLRILDSKKPNYFAVKQNQNFERHQMSL